MQEDISQCSKTLLTQIAKTCTCSYTRRAARSLTQYYDSMLQPSGLRSTQFCVLVVLALRGPVPVTQLADALGMDRTTLTRSLNVLVPQGFLALDEDADRRRRLVRLTKQGLQALEVALPYWQQAQNQIVASMGQEQWQELLTHLNAVLAVTEPD
jgi:DNA-binding MarR family transcriptional regulator